MGKITLKTILKSKQIVAIDDKEIKIAGRGPFSHKDQTEINKKIPEANKNPKY